MRSGWQTILRTKVVISLWSFLALWAHDMNPAGFEGSCLVVAPHPDDETLGCGAAIVQMCKAGRRVRVVAVTDGRASEEKCGLSPEGLAQRRKKEMLDACERLGVSAEDVVFLGYPDGEADGYVDSIRNDLEKEIQEMRPGQILSPSPCDSNADHRAVAVALNDLVRESDASAVVHEYIVWFEPLGYLFDMLPLALSGRLRRVTARAADMAAKKSAFDAHGSQYGGTKDPNQTRKRLWSRFFRPYEIFVETRIK